MSICVIDEGQVTRDTLRAFLVDLGHEVVCAKHCEEFLGLTKDEDRDLDLFVVQLSLYPPERTKGLQRIRDRFPKTPLVVMTSNGNVLPCQEAVGLGVCAFLHKPIRLAELELMVHRFAGGKRIHETPAKQDDAPPNDEKEDVDTGCHPLRSFTHEAEGAECQQKSGREPDSPVFTPTNKSSRFDDRGHIGVRGVTD